MKIIKWIFITAFTLPAVPIALVTINILQNGIGGWDGRTVEEILNKSAETATEEDIEKLSKSEVMQLFYAAHNKGRNHAMRDEIRRISDRLYVGLGYLTWNLGTLPKAG